jgi:hypothetical protein
MFYLIRRDDGYIFLQRYIPRNYSTVTFEVLAGPLPLAEIIQHPKRALTVRQFIEKEYDKPT